jgi:hypothetical protein
MEQKFIVDTNVLIDFQTKKLSLKGFEYVKNVIDDTFTISFISYIEFLSFNDVTPAMIGFISLAEMIEINKVIINQHQKKS